MSKFILVGDVGAGQTLDLPCAIWLMSYPHIHYLSPQMITPPEDVITHYLEGQRLQHEACIAIACPITNDWVDMTNHTHFQSIQ